MRQFGNWFEDSWKNAWAGHFGYPAENVLTPDQKEKIDHDAALQVMKASGGKVTYAQALDIVKHGPVIDPRTGKRGGGTADVNKMNADDAARAAGETNNGLLLLLGGVALLVVAVSSGGRR